MTTPRHPSPSPVTGRSARDRISAMRRTGRIYPPDERADVVAAELVGAPASVAAELGIAPGSRVIRRDRVTFRGDVPVSASTSWFDGALADASPALLRAERLLEGTAAYVEATTGRRMATGRDHLAARAATAEEAASLRVPVDSPVLAGRNWIHDAVGAVIEYGESVAPADHWRSYAYETSD